MNSREQPVKNENSIMRYVLLCLAYVFFDKRRSLLLCMLFVFASFYLERHFSVRNFFSCSGAIVSLAGLFLNIKYSLNFHLNLPKLNLYNKLSGAAVFGTSHITEVQEEWVDQILLDEMYGVSFMIVGTMIWAYGGYLVVAFQ